MEKRGKGQITLFIIMGVIILAFIGLALYLKNIEITQLEEDVVNDLALEPQRLNVYLESCLVQISPNLIENISANGGILNNTDYNSVTYYNKSYLFHCEQESGHGCVSKLITRKVIEDQLNQYLKEKVKNCINLSTLKKEGYSVKESEPIVSTKIGVRDIFVTLNYPIILSKEDFSISSDAVSIRVGSDLGYLYDLSVQIMNGEIENQFFDIDEWMRYNGDTKIYRHKPYPNTVYELWRYNDETKKTLSFRFAVNGFSSVDFIGNPDDFYNFINYGYCMTDDKNCYANVNPSRCNELIDNEQIGTYSDTKGNCEGTSEIMGFAGKEYPKALRYKKYCNPDGSCNDCVNMQHGESKCIYDGPAGQGWDYVGSRHYKQTCINGELITEECRDYREELCTEDSVSMEATCRVNRWEDCQAQTSESDCLDTTKRDCAWDENLADETTPTYGIKYEENQCHPEVPPGFKHWILPYNKVCQVANEYRRCDGFECPLLMNERQNLNCIYQGDCGMGRNVVDNLTDDGLHLTNVRFGDVREGMAYLPEGLVGSQNYRLNLPLEEMGRSQISNALYYYPDRELQALLEDTSDFIQEATTWDECTFCDCSPFGFPTSPSACTYTAQTSFVSVCSAWQAPLGGDECSRCSEDMNKPCTEYKCYSLGQGCQYYSSDGIGHCENAVAGDIIGPTISYNGNYPGNFTVENIGTIWGYSAYYLCNGDSCIDDSAGTDGIEPYSNIEFTVNLSEFAKCKASLVDMFEYDEVPEIIPTIQSYSFNTSYTYKTKVTSVDQLYDKYDAFFNYGSILQVIMLDEVDDLVTDTSTELISLLTQYGGDPSDIIDFTNYYFSNISIPLGNFIDTYKDVLTYFFMDVESKKSTVFFKCIDRAGNYEENDFILVYTIGPDRIPAILEYSDPVNRSFVNVPFNATLNFNEPVECKYSLINSTKGYYEMDDEMQCPIGAFDLARTGYKCKVEINGTFNPSQPIILNVACLDQPRLEENYSITLINTGSEPTLRNTFFRAYVNTTSDTINITNPNILQINSTIEIETDSNVELKLKFTKPYDCRYSLNTDLKFADMTEALYCNNNECTAPITVASTEKVYMRCIKKTAFGTTRNEGQYTLRYNIN